MIPFDDPARFNETVEQFFRETFVTRDRVKDFLASFEKMRSSQQQK
jgi:hypothetical protein